jgi:hypothetical protein
VQNTPFWSIGAIKATVLKTAREHTLNCTTTAGKGCFGTHSAHADSNGFASVAGL